MYCKELTHAVVGVGRGKPEILRADGQAGALRSTGGISSSEKPLLLRHFS